MAHAEKLLALINAERLRQERIIAAREKEASVKIRAALTKAEDEIERSARLLIESEKWVKEVKGA